MKNKRLRKGYVYVSAVLICMIHLPFSFAKTKGKVNNSNAADIIGISEAKLKSEKAFLYDSLQLNVLGLSQQAYDFAIRGMERLKATGKIVNDQLISIVDFTKSSSQKRLFIIDLQNRRLLFNTYVAHGQNSGTEFANRFSNSPESYQSSLGFYKTSDTYNGKNGYSMHLNGLERGINNNADERAIVMHGAPYVSEDFIRAQGYIGRSWGCPAVPEKLTKPIIDKIKNGTCLFIYSENKKYMKRSPILNS